MTKRCNKTIDIELLILKPIDIELLILEDKIKELIAEYKQCSDPFNKEINQVYCNMVDDLEKLLEK